MDQELTLIVPIQAKAECRDDVRRRLVALAEKTRQEPGNLCYVLHEVPTDPGHFVIYEQWKNQAALDFHMAQDYLKAFSADAPTLLAKPIAATVCHEIRSC